MIKRAKRILLAIALLLVVAALFLTGGVVLVHDTPEYYKPSTLTRGQIDAASQSAELTLTRMQNLAAETHGEHIRAAATSRPAATVPANANTFTFSQDELNALFEKWAELHGWRGEIDRVVADPMIILQPGHVIIAGHSKIKQLDTILSLHFEPRVDEQGRFDLNLSGVTAGKLPLPRESVLGPVRERALGSLRYRLQYWQDRARVEQTGIANQDAMYASLAKLLIGEFDRKPQRAILFLPSGSRGFVPVKLTDVRVEDRSITFCVVPFAPDERDELLKEIRQPPNEMLTIRPYRDADDLQPLRAIFNEIVERGDVFVYDAPLSAEQMRAYVASYSSAFVAESGGQIVGGYVMRANQPGRGAHVANATYLVAADSRGSGIGRALAEHSLSEAKRLGFAAMQFNAVVATNTAAIGLWRRLGFAISGTAPGAFRRAGGELLDLHIMYRPL